MQTPPTSSIRPTFRRVSIVMLAMLVALAVASPQPAAAFSSAPNAPNTPEQDLSSVSTPFVTDPTAVQISASEYHACALSPAGKVSCWGRNHYGQLGDNTTDSHDLPAPIVLAGTPIEGKRIAQVAAGLEHTCVRTVSHQISCWGRNVYGTLGNGTTDQSLVPTLVAVAGTPLQDKQIAHLTTEGRYVCALSTDGVGACWGFNGTGQLGTGISGAQAMPTAISTAGTPLESKAIAMLEAGSAHTCAVATDDTLACWGHGGQGALGTGSSSGSSTPIAVARAGTPLAGVTITGLSLGDQNACVTTSNFAASCWGSNEHGALGDGTTEHRSKPVSLKTAGTPLAHSKILTIDRGADTACAGDGIVMGCWGEGTAGQLGNGAKLSSSLPVALTTAGTPLAERRIDAFDVGGEFACALANDGLAACWGENEHGALGDSTTFDSSIAVHVGLGSTTPGAPTAVTAAAGLGSATVSWEKPTDTGGIPLRYFKVTPYNDGIEEDGDTFGKNDLEGQLFGLEPGAPYTFTVTAVNQQGSGAESVPSNVVVPVGANSGDDGTLYVPITPCRIVDTRNGGGPLANREIRDYRVTGDGPAFATQGGKAGGCNIPERATAVEASVTAVGPTSSGFFRAWPSGLSMPNATFMNFDRGMDITNTGAITIASDGGDDELRARNFGGSAQYVIDIQGYYAAGGDNGGGEVQANVEQPEQSLYNPIRPCRIVDTREVGGPLGNREIRNYRATGDGPVFAGQGGKADGCDIPEGTVAIEASITAVGPATSGFFRAWPSGQSMPNATFMNFDRGMDITNTGAITIASDGGDDELRVRNFGGAAQYVIDIQGYYSPIDFEGGVSPAQTSAVGRDASFYVPITPCRIVDTRDGAGPFDNREIRDFQASGLGDNIESQGGNPAGCGIPFEATALEASVTAVSPADSGFFRAWPAGRSMPNATFMNFDRGMDITNTGAITIAGPGDAGATPPMTNAEPVLQLRARNFGGSAQYVVDVQGYFMPLDIPS